ARAIVSPVLRFFYALSTFTLSETFSEQTAHGADGFPFINAFSRRKQFSAARGGKHQHAQDRFCICGRSPVCTLKSERALVGVRSANQKRSRTRVQAETVCYPNAPLNHLALLLRCKKFAR